MSQHLSSVSSVSVGRAYELLVLGVLRRYSFQLVHSGRPGDGGVDFVGHWTLPNTRASVVGQCKHHQSPLGPRDVREFESVVKRMTPPTDTVTGVLVSHSGFSQQATQTGLNSELPLILSQIRPLATDNDVTASYSDDITSNKDYITLGHSSDVKMSQQANSNCWRASGSKLSDRGLPVSHLGHTLWGNEESRVKCLRRKGYFTRHIPSELTCGYIRDFVMNHAMSSLYPCNSAVWRCGVEGEGAGEGREILLLFRCPVRGSVYDLGAVSRRHSGSGEPTAWQRKYDYSSSCVVT